MASNSAKTWARRDRTHTKAGKKRKKVDGRKSTPSEAELFATCGEPGKPAPAKA